MLLKPSIGARPVGDISTPELLRALEDIQNSGRVETANKVKSFASRVFDLAVIRGLAPHNPALSLRNALDTPEVRHHPAIVDAAQFGEFLRAVEGYKGYPSTMGALRLSAHVFQRPGEIRMMRWSDLKLPERAWIIPAEQTKIRRQHEVPLSRQALAIIKGMRSTAHGEFVFPAFHSWKVPLSENSVNQAIKRLGYGDVMTAHGFRSTASTLLNESGLWTPEAIERSLAHEVGSVVMRIYNRSAFWDERVRMHQWWSDYLDNLRDGTN